MHLRRTLPVCLLLSLFASQADAQFGRQPEIPPGENYHLEVGLRFWNPAPSIVIGSNALDVLNPGGVDFVQEFAITDKRFNEFRAALKGGRQKLRFSHVNLEYAQAARLQRTIEFGGRTFTVNANATADLQWEMWRIGYEYDFVAGSKGFFGFLGEANFNHVRADLQATDGITAVGSLTDEHVPVPVIGLAGRVYPHKNISIGAEFSGFKMPKYLASKIANTDNGNAHVRDLDITVTGSITRFFGIQGGYRVLSADYLLDNDSGDLKMKGPYFGLMARF